MRFLKLFFQVFDALKRLNLTDEIFRMDWYMKESKA